MNDRLAEVLEKLRRLAYDEGYELADDAADLLQSQQAEIERKDAALRKARDTFNHYGELHAAKPDKVKADANYAMAATMHRALNPSPARTPHMTEPTNDLEARVVWHEGIPPKPWCNEWFIAQTTFDDRVVLTALPEEYSYDFKTADDTYIKADRIVRWMQFPDSQYISPTANAPSVIAKALHESLSRQDIIAYLDGKFDCDVAAQDILTALHNQEHLKDD